MRKFALRNNRMQHLARVFYFFAPQVDQYIGIIMRLDSEDQEIWLYKEEPIDAVIESLAIKLNIEYHDYIPI